MKKAEVVKLKLGLYKIFWKDGGMSLPAVGQDSKGNYWLAPTNWIKVPSFKHWRYVLYVEEIVIH